MNKLKSINKKNSTIGIIAPASTDDIEKINENINLFKALGYKVKIGKNIFKSYGYLAGTDKERAEDINRMFADKEIDAIICYRGGYGCIRMANYLDLKTIKKNPKIFCGYSDITLLLNYINKKCKFPTFHGPMINSDFKDPLTRHYFTNILENINEKITYDLKNICNDNFKVYNSKDFKGKLVGGNLSIICSTIGTPYEIKFKNNILLIEEVNESPYVIDRMLSQLICSGKLNNLQAIILGHFTNCTSNKSTLTLEEIIEEKLLPLNIPIIKHFPCGHDYPNVTIPIGVTFRYDSKKHLLIQE